LPRLDAFASTAVAAISLAACATSALELAPERADRPWTPTVSATGEILGGKPPAPTTSSAGYVLPPNASLATVPAPPHVDPNKTYSLAELIDLAETSNPTTKIAWNEARRAALVAGIAEAAYLPIITASAVGAYQSLSNRLSTSGVPITNTSGVSVNNNGSATGAISALSLQWLLFDFGERGAVVSAAQQLAVISNIAFTAAHQLLIYAVSLAFYENAAARARETTAKQSLQNAQAVQAAAEDRYAHGIGTVVEAAQARQATAQARLALVQATGAAQDTYIAVVAAMGISPLTKIRIADVGNRPLSPAMDRSVEEIVSAALARRSDVLSAYAAEKASLANVEAAEAEFLPKLFVAATGTYNNGNLSVSALPSIGQQSATVNVTPSRLGGIIVGGLTVPLYDGGTRAALLARAQAEADSAKERLDRVREDAVREIVRAQTALRTSLSAYDAARALAAAAQTTFDAALAAYRNGVGSITDATAAQTALLQARNASTDAYSTALAAAATVALATGSLGRAPQ
jgi:outer membrane protein TolC